MMILLLQSGQDKCHIVGCTIGSCCWRTDKDQKMQAQKKIQQLIVRKEYNKIFFFFFSVYNVHWSPILILFWPCFHVSQFFLKSEIFSTAK